MCGYIEPIEPWVTKKIGIIAGIKSIYYEWKTCNIVSFNMIKGKKRNIGCT